MAGLVLALAGAAGATATGVAGADVVLTGWRLAAGLALLRGAFTGILEVEAALDAALAAGLAAVLTAGLSVCAGEVVVVLLVLGTAGVDASFMKISLEKLTVHTVYTVDFSRARNGVQKSGNSVDVHLKNPICFLPSILLFTQ